ncbi:uncharacterized protein LOC130906420 isoform X2 [Corythoichthys intestinalis]|uniref:uncharacterized protein LOC130906420 isoform X2 n=1 Tax=Corythoichthys intestinalis TaxID=161448 RepID=UPI0025A647BA|nr:uncharacterized protein LOC130906420 isoform X2 [Corythoichthys intestinalis]
MQGCSEEESRTTSIQADKRGGEDEVGGFKKYPEAEVEEGQEGGGQIHCEANIGETEVHDSKSSRDNTVEGDDKQMDAPPPTEAELTLGGPSEPCWYCLRSLDLECYPRAPQQDSDSSSLLLSGGQKVNYQTDPRPHFGVACSSHAPCRPLWGSEGPIWGQRGTSDGDDEKKEREQQTQQVCPHCHLALPADTLSWHEIKCIQFDGLRNPWS